MFTRRLDLYSTPSLILISICNANGAINMHKVLINLCGLGFIQRIDMWVYTKHSDIVPYYEKWKNLFLKNIILFSIFIILLFVGYILLIIKFKLDFIGSIIFFFYWMIFFPFIWLLIYLFVTLIIIYCYKIAIIK